MAVHNELSINQTVDKKFDLTLKAFEDKNYNYL